MTKYIHIINFKAEDVTKEEAREIGLGLIIKCMANVSKHVLVCVTDEPIDPRQDYRLKLAYEKEEKDGSME